MCLLILRRQAASLATAANYTLSDKRSIHDAIFIQQVATTLMTVQKYTIAIMMNITTQSKITPFVLKHLASYMLANYGKNHGL